MVPWGRSFAEYQAMFGLSEDDLKKRILGCGDGPASFNAEGTRRGIQITSCDPVYQFETKEIRCRIVDEVAHLESTRELCRVASEVRVFPVISLGGTASKHLDSVVTALSACGIEVSLQAVSYRFQKGATEMLVAKSV